MTTGVTSENATFISGMIEVERNVNPLTLTNLSISLGFNSRIPFQPN